MVVKSLKNPGISVKTYMQLELEIIVYNIERVVKRCKTQVGLHATAAIYHIHVGI
jgi:hypothetical protein